MKTSRNPVVQLYQIIPGGILGPDVGLIASLINNLDPCFFSKTLDGLDEGISISMTKLMTPPPALMKQWYTFLSGMRKDGVFSLGTTASPPIANGYTRRRWKRYQPVDSPTRSYRRNHHCYQPPFSNRAGVGLNVFFEGSGE